MTIETDFPGVLLADAAAIARNIEFFQDGYDTVVNRTIAPRGRKEVLGKKTNVAFKKEAYTLPELAGNRTLISLYECDECNDRFSAFEDDLGKLTLLERIAGQVLEKAGVPSAKAGQKKSRKSRSTPGIRS